MSTDSKPQLLLTGLTFGESPRWHAGQLWVSDWGTRQLITVSQDGKREVMVTLPFSSFQPICMDWLPDGRLLIVSSAEGRLLCRQPDGSLTTYAELSQLSDKSWNEIVVDGRGDAYVNGEVMALVTPDGTVRPVASGFAFPNGMAITPDGATLLVAESSANRVSAFSVAGDGSLSGRAVFATFGEGRPDGICLDAEGALWVASPATGELTRVLPGGEVTDRLDPPQGQAQACMLGGTDGRSLYVCSTPTHDFEEALRLRAGRVDVTRVEVAGAGWP